MKRALMSSRFIISLAVSWYMHVLQGEIPYFMPNPGDRRRKSAEPNMGLDIMISVLALPSYTP
jgi:hypothetical protein